MNEALTKLLHELTDPSADVKIADLTDLSDLDEDHAGELRRRWSDITVRRRRWLLRELIDLSEDNVELNFDRVYFSGLRDEDPQVRKEAVRGLWEYESVDLVDPLVEMAEGDSSAAVRAEAALALGRYVMAHALGRLRDRYFARVERGLKKLIESEDEVDEVRARALEAMGPRNTAWVRQAIREAYESGVRRMKASAVHAMGRSAEERWLPLIVREMSSEEPELRFEAAIAAGAIGDQSVLPHLVRLAHDSDEEVSHASVIALGEIGGNRAKAALRELASDPAPALRDAANAALEEIRFEEDPLSFGLGFGLDRD